jgi:hypothetical protein
VDVGVEKLYPMVYWYSWRMVFNFSPDSKEVIM